MATFPDFDYAIGRPGLYQRRVYRLLVEDSRSCDSSSTERFKRNQGNKMPVELEHQLYKHQNSDRTQSVKEPIGKKKGNDDTCSCVSCALKKVIGSDYACVGCIALVFTISVMVAFLVVFKNAGPGCISSQMEARTNSAAKKTELLKSRRQFRSDRSSFDGYSGRKPWNDFSTNPWRNLVGLSASGDFPDSSLRDPNYQDETAAKATGALSQILESEKMVADVQTSDRLRDFYTRLIQTDARIRKLKQQTEEANHIYSSVDNTKPISDRYKRSLMSINSRSNSDTLRREVDYDNKIDLSKFNLFYPPFVAVKDYADVNQKPRIKRLEEDNYNEVPSGILIENKKVMVQYGPMDRKRNFPKCSHLPKDSKSHEKQLKHPFYKNSQRLDELLGHILDKNLDKVIANPFNLDLLFGEKEKCKHKHEQKGTSKSEDEGVKQTKSLDEGKITGVKKKHVNSDPKSSFYEKDALHKDEEEDTDEFFLPSTTSRYDIVLSVSTLINSDTTETGKISKHDADVSVSKRKLLQMNEEDDENLGYEDLKEVLSDYTDTHDETDKQVERDKRALDTETNAKDKSLNNNYKAPTIHNTNWKGPMQLYPDELNLMINNAAIQTLKDEMLNDVKRMSDDKMKVKTADTDYVEDYLNDKYSKLAQAYSDYGVLSAKKEFVTIENSLPSVSKGYHHEYRKEPTPTEREATARNESFKKRRSAKLRRFNNLKKNLVLEDLSKRNQLEVSTSRKLRSLKSVEDDLEQLRSNISDNNTVESPKEILQIFSDWFLTLAKLSGEYQDNSTQIKENNATQPLKSTQARSNVTKDIMYPMYDADMIDNIGHRSRVLMTIQETNENVNITSLLNKTNLSTKKISPAIKPNKEDKQTKMTSVKSSKQTVPVHVKLNASSNVSLTTATLDVKDNKPVVKRSVDSNLIFWNDLYDDEYGVKIDYFDNEMRNKHSADKENFVKRSGQWFNKKWKKFGDSIRTGYNSNKTWRRSTKRKNLRSVTDLSQKSRVIYSTQPFQEEDLDKPVDFRSLTAKMKQICREAARAVQKTRNINVREEKGSEYGATSLMQQLVKLMTDLVDFQVQQKTCAKLPPDLEDFLQWLTSTSSSDDYKDQRLDMILSGATTHDYNLYKTKDSMPSEVYVAPTRDDQDSKAECHAILSEVQNLLSQYDEMSYEEKSKLTGIKEYLENQMEFLVRLLPSYSEYNVPDPAPASTLYHRIAALIHVAEIIW
ncbi:uncharacterized protein [Battus philenor]|uniref:uncharacterized protein n=1 Tax=Battus philenor TaxID=42288 RepID=UPI0035D08AC4